MSASRAFDLALWVPSTPSNPGDGVLVAAVGPPFASGFAPLVQGVKPGITVGASMPAANAANQILLSGAGPGFAWGLVSNPAAAAQVPPPTAQNQLVLSDASNMWQTSSISAVLTLGGAITASVGGVFANSANISFTPSGALATRIDGGDPSLSRLDNFTLDQGTF